MKEQIKAVLLELSNEQIQQIKDSDNEYVIFDVSIFNTGAVVRIILTDEYPFYDNEETFVNKYGVDSFVLETWDVIECLNKLKL